MKKTLRTMFARMAPAAILFLTPALSLASTIRLIPSSTTVTAGDIFNLDLVAENLQLGGYDVTFNYNPLLAAIDDRQATFDTHLGGPDNSLAFAFGGLDTLELLEVSLLTAPADLAALQTGSSYCLAHIPVKALSPGTLSFAFAAMPFTSATDYLGVSIDGVAYEGASVTILAATTEPPPNPTPAPEPDSAILLLSGMGLLAVRLARPRSGGARRSAGS